MSRFNIFVGGKWQGGSFATREAADAVVATLRSKSRDQVIEVRQKAVLPAPNFEPKGVSISSYVEASASPQEIAKAILGAIEDQRDEAERSCARGAQRRGRALRG